MMIMMMMMSKKKGKMSVDVFGTKQFYMRCGKHKASRQ